MCVARCALGYQGEQVRHPSTALPEHGSSQTMARVLVARVERLQGQVKAMSSRIKELESALSEAQLHVNKQTHPLLSVSVKWEEPDEVHLPPESDTESLSGVPYEENEETATVQHPEVRLLALQCGVWTELIIPRI
jgi:predicted nuclease with TOPRIM domain